MPNIFYEREIFIVWWHLSKLGCDRHESHTPEYGVCKNLATLRYF